MTATMTFAGLDVHARSIHAAAIDVRTGELRRVRFGARSEEAISWLQALPQPVRACYEAGPTGFALYRAAEAAGVPVEVVAPSKTPRAPGDRIKTDRKLQRVPSRSGSRAGTARGVGNKPVRTFERVAALVDCGALVFDRPEGRARREARRRRRLVWAAG